MPSPFPGMDPYLENPSIWPDAHEALATELRNTLNHSLPAPYYARLEMRPEVGVIEESHPPRRIIPDVAVVESARHSTRLAVVDKPRTEASRSYEVAVASETGQHRFVEIRDPAQGHRLVTLIEIVSPSNKLSGADRDSYVRKQREVLSSDANLIEIDLLREGARLVPDVLIQQFLANLEPGADYLVLVNRAWRRSNETAYQIYPFTIREPLPCISVPLREGHDEVLLDLQIVLNRVYDGGPYRRGAVDYSRPPAPALREQDQEWAQTLLGQMR